MPYIVVPIRSFYIFDPKYAQKHGFKEEYKKATFYDNTFNAVSIDDLTKRDYKKLIVENNELDLIIPATASDLPEVVCHIQELDKIGSFPWIDPAVIIKTDGKIPQLPGFDSNAIFLCITRENEELYTLLHGDNRINAVKEYLNTACNANKIKGTSVACHPALYNSQINKEFSNYMINMLGPLKYVE